MKQSHLAITLLTLFFSLSACKEPAIETTKALPKIKVVVASPTQTQRSVAIDASGELEAIKTTSIGFQVPGKVVDVCIQEGEAVKKGQLLARLEAEDFKNELDIAEANLLEATDHHKRVYPLFQSGAVTEKEYILAHAALLRARAARNIAAKKVKETQLSAPISGLIGSKDVELGQSVSVGSPLLSIVKTDRIFARVSVPESEIGILRCGQKAQVSIKAFDGKIFDGSVSIIGAVAEPRTRSYPVKIRIENPELLLRTGMIANASILTHAPITHLSVPGHAIVRDPDNLSYLFVVDKTGKMALKKRVTPQGLWRDKVIISQGLAPSDRIIVSGQHRLTDGQSIEIIKGS
ncbi:MAG: efflux RND transporter periplasmic adaptor subunit [Desulfobacterales bacterium]|nr:efflux RND transporter periplasmic adaptor subunit [Desulfobacterales bacterium]